MLRKSRSITKRLILAVLIVEFVAAIVLISAVTMEEHKVQNEAFDANLQGTANVLFGAVQDAEDVGDNVLLDLRGVSIPHDAIYRVQDDKGRILGASGRVPQVPILPDQYRSLRVNRRSYRFFALSADRIIDPTENGGIHHAISIIYGLPDGHVWHEVFEAVRFFVLASLILLSLTAVLLVWLIRKLTGPIHQLANAAEAISVFDWSFVPPANAREIEELQPLIAALELALARLHRSFQQQKRFTSDAAHELKTDLAIVKSSFQLLSMKERTSEEYQKGVSLGLTDLARLEETVQRMLTLARLEQPAIGGEHLCRLDQILEEAIHMALPAAEVKGVTLSLVHSTSALVHCDTRDALLLCSNILMNAINYTAENSTIEIDLHTDSGSCVMKIADAGRGIEESELQHLFEPFYRGDPSRSRKSGGTGLGLSICKAVCDRAGGSISIANRIEGGAIVTVNLPLTAVTE